MKVLIGCERSGVIREAFRAYVAERVREAVEAEREACAQDAYGTAFRCHAKDDIDFHSGCVQTRDGIVAAIRARSKTEAER